MKGALEPLYKPANLGIDNEFLETLTKRSAREGEQALMLAILDDAIACFQKYLFAQNKKGKALFREAEDWILEENSDWIFSFENICEVLELDPKYVRQGLMCWKETRLASQPKAKIYHLPSREQREKISHSKVAESNPNIGQDVRKAHAL